MFGYHEAKKDFVKHLIKAAKEEIHFLEEEVVKLEQMVVGSVKKASSVALEIAKNAEPDDRPFIVKRKQQPFISDVAAKAKTKNNGAIARKPKKRKYQKRSKYWKK
jgi:hypothetical protein